MNQLKHTIQQHIQQFSSGALLENSLSLFETLGYRSDIRMQMEPNTAEQFLKLYDAQDIFDEKRKSRARCEEWTSVDFLFQLTETDIPHQNTLFEVNELDPNQYHSYLFFAIELPGDAYPRGALATITREVNRLFLMPAIILFTYGSYVTFSIINRRLSKTDPNKDVLEKVTLIKDISITMPHRAHVEILFDLSLHELKRKHPVTNFVELHQAWQNTLDSSELNKVFYQELAIWYFEAMRRVEFPNDAEADREIRNATNLIRLLTRLIFVWFLKEKGLIPHDLFDTRTLDTVLNYQDANESTFYKAILQNLFFATLNQEPNKRAFRRPEQHYTVTNLYRYEHLFTVSQDNVLELFTDIPFLNGGLFECLDKLPPAEKTRHGSEKIVRIDGFSERKDNPLHVPDALFFGEERDVDLNDVFGTTHTRYRFKGLIHLLNRYKFTIDENTPITEEIALDPELLGKVFENLLAAYTPETKTTARKRTGSFYTPREIVEYMVDESLKASLAHLVAQKLPHTPEGDMQTGFEILFAYTEQEHAFTDDEVSKILEAIAELKILDPACGSGAFPMGILHKLVYILTKLDKENVQWRTLQKRKALQDTEEAYNTREKDERRQRLQEIEEAFDLNTSDYGRKLYLIENSIYGVDIQPIAVQISMLRFFISLIVDQKIDRSRDNLGIRPLPNLETKFVAANTLIGIEKPHKQGNLFENPEIKQREQRLKELRHKHFTAKTLATKRTYRQEDRAIRERIAALLQTGFGDETTARQLAEWNPCDQNASSPFFDPEWMFGVQEGFDVVIGNPPYFNLNKVPKKFVNLLKSSYDRIHTGYNDIVYYFLYLSIELLKPNGFSVLITSNYFLGNEYAQKLRNSLKSHLVKLINFKDYKVFESASIHTCISFYKKSNCSHSIHYLEACNDMHVTTTSLEEQCKTFQLQRTELDGTWIVAERESQRLVKKLQKHNVSLGKIAEIEKGSTSGKNDVFTITPTQIDSYNLEQEILRKNIKNSDIQKYYFRDRGESLIYVDNNTNIERYPNILSYLSKHRSALENRNEVKKGRHFWFRFERPRRKKIFDADEKIIVPYRSEHNRFAYDQSQHFNNGGDIRAIVITDSRFHIKYVLALLNSSLLDWHYGYIGKSKGKAREYFNTPLAKIPIAEASEQKQQSFIPLVDHILAAKQQHPDADTSGPERRIDLMVYTLYDLTYEEVQIVDPDIALSAEEYEQLTLSRKEE